MHDQDTEITLGTGKLLGLFFLLAVLCGVFFVIGYSFGRNTASAATKTVPVLAPVVPSTSATTATKPSAELQPDCTRTAAGCMPSATAPAPAPAVRSAVEAPPAPVNVAPAPLPPANSRKAPASEPARTTPGPGYVVQVAAISKRQDAEALQTALRRKQYQVFIAQPETDSLFHVQIGPFADRKDADSMRLRLVGDGYSPIVK
jgi:cell division septation protein DedD